MKKLLFILFLPFSVLAQIPFIAGTTNRTNYSEDFVIVNNSVKGTDGYEHSYVGTWNDFTAVGHYDGDATYSGISGDSIIFRFNGTKAELFFEEKSTLGKANISLDGGAYTEIDLYNAVNTQKVLKYTTGTISQDLHTLVIKVLHTKHASSTNYYVVYDYVKVYDPLPVPIPPAPESIAWHVETRGSDSNPCTLASPCLTLDYVVDNIAQDGDTISVGIGTFVETDYITPGHGVSIIGSGINQTTIKLTTSLNQAFDPATFSYHDDAYLFQYISSAGDQVLADLTIEGQSRGTFGGIFLSGVDSVKFERLAINNFGFTGMWLKNTEADTVKDVSGSNSSTSIYSVSPSANFSTGAFMIGGSTVDDVVFDNVVSDELTVGAVRGYNFKVMGPSPTSPTIDNIQLIDFVGTTSATSNYGGGGTSNVGIEMHNTTMTNVLIQGGSSNETMSLVRPDGQTDPGGHALTVDGHSFNPVGGYCMELTFHNVIIKNNYFNGGKFASIFNTDSNGPSATNWLIHHNVFYNPYTSGGQAGGIRATYYGFLNMNVYNNTFHWPSSSSGTSVLVTFNGINSSNINLKNNLVWDETSTAVFTLNGGGTVTGSTFSYNQFYGLPEGAVSGVTYSNNLTTDPLLQATGAKPDPYYRITTGSPADQSGTDVSLPYNGTAPSRGAYEIQE